MPVPIKPVREIEDNLPSAFKDGGFAAMGLSELQVDFLGLADKEAAKKILVDSRDAEMLQDIWSQQNEQILVSAEDLKEIKISVPATIPERDVIRMKTNGLIIGADRNVSLTSKGEKVLKDKILSQPSAYFLNRTKEQHEFEKTAGKKKLRIITE